MSVILQDCLSGLRKLADQQMRRDVGILDENSYVFTNTEMSPFHVLVWHATRKMCIEVKVAQPKLLTASKQRHRISTIYASLEVPETEREVFYRHMGHSRSVNIGIYQYPLPLPEMTKVGKHPKDNDEGKD